ncbi:11787_t:CDS:2 [Dentiscutata heterogama]|uniref:11787_t:CDS:1 n=1 Tax=Dentiscutata heterogama TaxID=1316150 RepID=A0ACA9P1W6_9GLOM|nr:11787_t:CDS:2 [Dentiscutata heterogama]
MNQLSLLATKTHYIDAIKIKWYLQFAEASECLNAKNLPLSYFKFQFTDCISKIDSVIGQLECFIDFFIRPPHYNHVELDPESNKLDIFIL